MSTSNVYFRHFFFESIRKTKVWFEIRKTPYRIDSFSSQSINPIINDFHCLLPVIFGNIAGNSFHSLRLVKLRHNPKKKWTTTFNLSHAIKHTKEIYRSALFGEFIINANPHVFRFDLSGKVKRERQREYYVLYLFIYVRRLFHQSFSIQYTCTFLFFLLLFALSINEWALRVSEWVYTVFFFLVVCFEWHLLCK